MQERGYPPSMREIGEAVGLASTSSVAFQLATLQRKGYLRRPPRIVDVRLPGDPAAQPEPGPEDDQTADMPGIAIFPLPEQVVGGGALVLHKVVGDSMIGAAVTDGDWVVVRQQSSAQDGDLRDGDLVAAEIDGVATVRALERSGGQVFLRPRNPAYMPTLEEKASILGRVVAVLRVGAAALQSLPRTDAPEARRAKASRSYGRSPLVPAQHPWPQGDLRALTWLSLCRA